DALISDLTAAYGTNPAVVKQVGNYLELQFAEAYKDMGKASQDIYTMQVRPECTLAQGGDRLGLIYKPGGDGLAGEFDSNHVNGDNDASTWFVDGQRWQDIAVGIRSALTWELGPSQ